MNNTWKALRLFLWMTFLTGVIYPIFILAIAKLAMNDKAEGSLISSQERIVGSKLIAQKFEKEKYFWPRPSNGDYNPLISGGSNLGPTSEELKKLVQNRKAKYLKSGLEQSKEVPSDMLYASGSGLDPHIKISTAYFQVDRIVEARKLNAIDGKKMIVDLIKSMQISKKYVNVLLLNIALDDISNNNGIKNINE